MDAPGEDEARGSTDEPSTQPSRTSHLFQRFATAVSSRAGHSFAFIAAAALVVVWAASGPVFGFSDTWQLIINTGTTVLTFLMVFLIQNTMNRDSVALHVKLDELIRVTSQARDALMGVEDLDEEQVRAIEERLKSGGASRGSSAEPDDVDVPA
jgi:low affinity Fe/Cu permease